MRLGGGVGGEHSVLPDNKHTISRAKILRRYHPHTRHFHNHDKTLYLTPTSKELAWTVFSLHERHMCPNTRSHV